MLYYSFLFKILPKRKGPYGPVGIKNSWKYEKDLIILNVINTFFTINQLCYIFVDLDYLIELL